MCLRFQGNYGTPKKSKKIEIPDHFLCEHNNKNNNNNNSEVSLYLGYLLHMEYLVLICFSWKGHFLLSSGRSFMTL
jgi:hypothetical protein